MRRPDWLCPRCRMPVEADVPPPRAPRRVSYEKGFPGGSRIAGAILAVASAALAVGVARYPPAEHRWPLVAAAVVLAALGVTLLVKLSFARWAAAIVAVAAILLGAEGLIRDRLPDLLHDPLPGAIRLPLRDVFRALQPARIFLVPGFALGALLLILGRPGRVRLAAGLLLAAPMVVVEIMRAFGR